SCAGAGSPGGATSGSRAARASVRRAKASTSRGAPSRADTRSTAARPEPAPHEPARSTGQVRSSRRSNRRSNRSGQRRHDLSAEGEPGPAASVRFSVVVPTWNEALELPGLLASLAAQGERHEVIVADGQSRDGTAELAARLGARVVSTLRGRGRQLASGA